MIAAVLGALTYLAFSITGSVWNKPCIRHAPWLVGVEEIPPPPCSKRVSIINMPVKVDTAIPDTSIPEDNNIRVIFEDEKGSLLAPCIDKISSYPTVAEIFKGEVVSEHSSKDYGLPIKRDDGVMRWCLAEIPKGNFNVVFVNKSSCRDIFWYRICAFVQMRDNEFYRFYSNVRPKLSFTGFSPFPHQSLGSDPQDDSESRDKNSSYRNDLIVPVSYELAFVDESKPKEFEKGGYVIFGGIIVGGLFSIWYAWLIGRK